MSSRHVYEVVLRPVIGSTFQPTGFPDLGAATFDRWETDGKSQERVRQSSLLVESVQSMANRLEGTAWDDAANGPVAEAAGLPYVEVRRASTREFLTSSRLEAHRLFSAFIRDSTWDGRSGDQVLLDRLGAQPDTPLDRRHMARAIMSLDPFSLLHGVFFAGQTKAKNDRVAWPTQPKFARAVAGVIEAHNVFRVVSGGRKADHVRHREDEAVAGGSAEGYGSVPFHRTEWTADRIIASFVVDVELIQSYGLPDAASEMLETLALWEIRSLLEGGLRLRTACDLEVVDGTLTSKHGRELPSVDALSDDLARLRADAGDVLGEGAAIPVTWAPKGKKS